MTMYTIRPKNGESVVAWVLKHGDEIKTIEPRTHVTMLGTVKTMYVVCCLFRATHGPILRVCYNALELRNARISCANHSGPCRWFWVPIETVKPFMLGQEIK